MTEKGRRPTIQTVAQDAGVSRSAVSKVLCNAYGISPELRSRVMASIDRLGYRPSTSARAMRGRAYTLGVVASDIHNPFFADVTVGISRKLQETAYQPLLGFSLTNGEKELSLVEAMLDRQVDGLIWIAPRVDGKSLRDIARRIPLVLVAYHAADSDDFDTANVDDELGALMAVEHLGASGRQRIAMVSVTWPGTTGSVVRRREHGYLKGMSRLGLSDHAKIVHVEESAADIGAVADALLRQPQRPDALFCWNDFAALEMLSLTRTLGLEVPRDIAIVGFDNTSFCRLAQNSLSSIDQFAEMLGENAAEMMLERIEGRIPSRHIKLEPSLVLRDSSAAPGIKIARSRGRNSQS